MFDKPKILIVDDEPRMCQSLMELLAGKNYELNAANSAKEAIEFLINNNVALILLDIVLPNMDGYHVMDHIGRQSPDTLVIILTGYASVESAIEALRRGAYDYIKKPFEPEKLSAIVKNALNQQKVKKDYELAKEALWKNEKYYRLLVETMKDGLAVADEKGIITYVNSQACEMIGYTIEEILGRPVKGLLHTDSFETWEEQPTRQQLSEGSRYELGMVHKDGQKIYVLVSPKAIFDSDGHFNGSFAVLTDITDKKLEEEALKERENTLRSIFRAAPTGIGLVCDRVIKKANEKLCEILGYTREELLDKNARKLYPTEEDFEYVGLEKYAQIREKGIGTVETRWQRQDGKVIDILLSSTPIDLNDLSKGVIFTALDITARKHAEEELRESEEKFRSMMESMQDEAYICSPDFHIKYMNPAMISRIGRDASGELCNKVLYDRDEKCPWCIYDQVLQGEHIQYEVLNPKDKRYYQVSNSPIFHTDGSISKLTIFRDITERRKMEAEILKTKKLESLGTLSGGIAHDFNNLLSVIVGNIDLAKDKIKHDLGVFENLQEVEKASLRASDLAARLITFSKGGKPIKKVASIGELVKNAVSASLSGSGINCEFSIPDDLFPVVIDALQIKQVIRNIVTNATEAMNGKGTINVYCENAAVCEKDRLPLKAGKYVLLSIKDQGSGITPKNLAKIFDPYFSTKDMGADKGQGLGLAACHSIIKKHDGFITAESELGVGTTLIIYFPASEKKIEALQPIQKSLPEKPMIGIGRILAMDDEKMIRDLIEQMLSQFGYDVALAQDGTEAVELYRSAMESGKPFDAVILDLTVKSGMGGKYAAQKLLEINPHVKAIVSSGYYNDLVMTDFKKYGFTAALAKPYSMKALKDTLSKVLMGKSADH